MRRAEWSLIAFTLLVQLAVGMFLVLWTANFLYISTSDNFADTGFFDKILLSILVILMIAVLSSLFHIGRPKNAAYAVAHLSKSWLSREIAFLMLFIIFAAILYVLPHTRNGSFPIREGLAIITGLIGILTIISMAKVYMLETIPAWNTVVTPIQFMNTSLLLGACTSLLLFIHFRDRLGFGSLMSDSMKVLLPVLLLLLSLNLITSSIFVFMLRGAGSAGVQSLRLPTGKHVVFHVLRLTLIFVSILLLWIFWQAGTRAPAMFPLVILCFVMYISEIMGRYLFYASYGRIGV